MGQHSKQCSCSFAFTVSGFTSLRCVQRYFPEEFLWQFCGCELAVVEIPSANGLLHPCLLQELGLFQALTAASCVQPCNLLRGLESVPIQCPCVIGEVPNFQEHLPFRTGAAARNFVFRAMPRKATYSQCKLISLYRNLF